MIKGYHHLALICSGEEAITFYTALGFQEVRRIYRPERDDTIVWMEGYGETLEIFIDVTHPARPSYPEAMGLRHLAFYVSDIEEEIAKLKAIGYEAEPIRFDAFTGEKMTFVKDPDGLPIELHE